MVFVWSRMTIDWKVTQWFIVCACKIVGFVRDLIQFKCIFCMKEKPGSERDDLFKTIRTQEQAEIGRKQFRVRENRFPAGLITVTLWTEKEHYYFDINWKPCRNFRFAVVEINCRERTTWVPTENSIYYDDYSENRLSY